MILDNLEHMEQYKALHPALAKGLAVLQRDLSVQLDGRYEVEGEDLYYMIQSYQTRPDNDLPEAHRRYLDIQCVLQGEEVIAVGPLSSMKLVEEHPDRDLWLYHGEMDRITLRPGRFVVLFPQDAHAAAIAVKEPSHCNKVVVKVRWE